MFVFHASVASAKTTSTGTLWEHCDSFQRLPKGKGRDKSVVKSNEKNTLRGNFNFFWSIYKTTVLNFLCMYVCMVVKMYSGKFGIQASVVGQNEI